MASQGNGYTRGVVDIIAVGGAFRFISGKSVHKCIVRIRVVEQAVEAGVIGAVSSRFYGVPTDYSQRRTKEIDAPDVVQWCKEDGVDAVILVPL